MQDRRERFRTGGQAIAEGIWCTLEDNCQTGRAASEIFLSLMIGAPWIHIIDALQDRPASRSVSLHARAGYVETRLLKTQIRAAWRLGCVRSILDSSLSHDLQPIRPVHRRETTCADDRRFHLPIPSAFPFTLGRVTRSRNAPMFRRDLRVQSQTFPPGL